MQPKELADRLGVTSNTVRRWCDDFHPFLTPTASPPKGKARVLSDLDVRILHYIGQARDLGHTIESITARLDSMQAADWQDLPDIPPDWTGATETVSVVRASEKAFDFAQIAVLQKELEFRDQRLIEAHQALEIAQGRVEALERDNEVLRASGDATAAEKHALELELSQARGEVATLQARLAGYAITGGDKPLPVALIVAVTALAVLVALVLMLIVVRLVL